MKNSNRDGAKFAGSFFAQAGAATCGDEFLIRGRLDKPPARIHDHGESMSRRPMNCMASGRVVIVVIACSATPVSAAPPEPEAEPETDAISAILARTSPDIAGEGGGPRGDFEDLRLRWRRKVGLDYAVTFSNYGATVLINDDLATAASGELAVQGAWKIGHRWGADLASLNFRLRERVAYGPLAPADLGRELGTLWGIADGFTDAGFQVPDFYFSHRFARSGIELRYGQMAIDNQFDSHALSSAKQAFLNQAFASNPAVAFPGFGAGITLARDFDNGFGIALGATNIQAVDRNSEVSFKLASGEFFEALQFSYDFTAWPENASRLQLVLWNSDSLPAEGIPGGRGLSLTYEQQLDGPDLRFFSRLSLARGGSTEVEGLLSGGIAWQRGERHLVGVAFGLGRGSEASHPVQSVLEAFYRWQPTERVHISPDLQFLMGEGFVGSPGTRLIVGLRAGVSF